jgi:predicted PurR-regulated permease PerM
MIPLRQGSTYQGARALLTTACFVVVVAGMRAASEVLLPLLVAVFLSMLAIPPMRRLQRHRVPDWAAIAIVVTLSTVILGAITVVVGQSSTRFYEELPHYRDRLDEILASATAWLRGHELDVPDRDLSGWFDTARAMELAADTARGLLAAVSNLVLVIITMIFMLLEAQTFSRKWALMTRDPSAGGAGSGGEGGTALSRASDQVHRYLATKAWLSLANGVAATIVCVACGVDVPLLWGLVALLFNFVPNIGSVLAAIPPVMLAAIDHGPLRALAVAAGYIALNVVIDNIVEPKVMGRRLGLSPLMVFVSLIFWGWVWGPVGMLLSVPLTVVLKIVLEHSADFRWLAIVLGSGDELPPLHPTAPPGAPPPAQSVSSVAE